MTPLLLAPVDAVVHDGDRVRGAGLVVALPGRPVRLCGGGRSRAARLRPSPPPYCELGVTLLGADLDRLAGRLERGGAVWGRAEVTGVYRSGTVAVTDQSTTSTMPPARADRSALPADCPPPAGGWQRGGAQGLPGIEEALAYVAAHPDVLGSLSLASPGPPAGKARPAVQVLLIGTTGDVEEARRAVRQWYAGPLCVRAVPHSRAQLLAARAVLAAALDDPAQQARYGILGGLGEFSVGGDPRTSVQVMVYDQGVHELRARAGPDLVEVEPTLRKLR